MLRILLFSLLIFGFSFAGHTKIIDIREAVKSGWVSMTIEANGGHSGKSIRLKLINLKKRKYQIFVPAGLIFASVDSAAQDLIIIQERLLSLKKREKRSFTLYAMCTQAQHFSPQEKSLFSLQKETTDENLIKLITYIDKNAIRTQAAQYAIWAITDHKRIAYIRHKELAIFTAQLLNKPIPVYYVVHANHNRPGQIAFVDHPVTIEGTFKYTSDKARKVSFGLYDKNGKLLYSAFENKEQKSGHHKFKFRFKVHNVAKGKYYARLMSNRAVLEELAVEF